MKAGFTALSVSGTIRDERCPAQQYTVRINLILMNFHTVKTYVGGVAMNPLDTITGTIVTGLVLTVILIFVIKALAGA